ncbi:hypothetical protein BX616_000331 [Lobosporangium transversale]|uniref:Domain of unknown function at the cortex 1 domain-containing protein n=1 Tax=Lobosporangium transversale TaxID=64571 RepID=A0A1Y2GTQ9_9FUNG|nr:hypothetical protein BCR41DRAFT_320381 [Lobosporangium transversale]KAF9917644.1 hypothetical protein BX616_000331 [Lobosporangium transversale]ORZ21739.1 hypothetical protein BCR41DRAFT_320381 [Lobosporangium transversale]|eukprot:XP_021882990.1 hypothetical protein BCR41DRAFT_320381 [Lobosporangium transversale]
MSPYTPTRFRLRVSAGPSADPKDLKLITVNDDANPLLIESDEFIGQIVVRIRGLDKTYGYADGQAEDGLKTMSDSPWFTKPGGDNNLSSIQISGRFKREWPGDQIVFGNQFERPLKLPPFSSIALKFVQFIDPGLKADIYCERPWAFSPLIATMNTINVAGWHIDPAAQQRVEQSGGDKAKERLENELPPWPSPEGEHIVEDTNILFQKDNLKKQEEEQQKRKEQEEQQRQEDANSGEDKEELVETRSGSKLTESTPHNMTSSARRSYFAREVNLTKHRYRPDHVYGFDFFNPYLDFAHFTLKVPGFSVDITKYWDGQPLTYILKTADSSVVFMAFQFEMVPVKDITVE